MSSPAKNHTDFYLRKGILISTSETPEQTEFLVEWRTYAASHKEGSAVLLADGENEPCVRFCKTKRKEMKIPPKSPQKFQNE